MNGERFERMTDGTLAKYTSIGCYPIFYLDPGTECLCADCARKAEAEGEPIDGQAVNWEDPDLYCAACEERIESAYAEDTATG